MRPPSRASISPCCWRSSGSFSDRSVSTTAARSPIHAGAAPGTGGSFVGGVVPALVFGVAFGNLLLGVPFHLDDMLRSFYTGSFIALFHPFALLAGIVSVAMLTMHGAIWLQLRTAEPISVARESEACSDLGVKHRGLCARRRLADLGIDGFRVVSMPRAGCDAQSADQRGGRGVLGLAGQLRRLSLDAALPGPGLRRPLGGDALSPSRSSRTGARHQQPGAHRDHRDGRARLFPFILPSSTDPTAASSPGTRSPAT